MMGLMMGIIEVLAVEFRDMEFEGMKVHRTWFR
jgi:hypothetical protein